MKVTRELVEALTKLKPYPSFQLFVDAIIQDQTEGLVELMDAPSDRVGRLQGRTKFAQDILQVITEAEAVLAKYQKQDLPQTLLGENDHGRSTRISSTSRGAF